MSPGIRSGVNCTRLVSTDSAAARVRTSSVFAVPGTPSISTWPPQSSATSRPETAASCPTTALPTSARTAASRSRAAPESGVWSVLGHVRRTSLSSSASCLARVIRSRSEDGTTPAGPRSGHDVLLGAAGAPGHLAGQDVGRGGGAEPQPLGEPGPRRPAQRLRRVAAVARAAVEPAQAAGGLDGAHHDRQRLGGEGAQPAGPPEDHGDHDDRERAPGRAGPSGAAGSGGSRRRRR